MHPRYFHAIQPKETLAHYYVQWIKETSNCLLYCGSAILKLVKAVIAIGLTNFVPVAMGQSRYASSDSMSGYVHWIDLYDASNTRVDPAAENPQPYSPQHTCGRCHDFNTISHGWHFNAIDPQANHGRPGQPWIWSDGRTGTHLPLSYRHWMGTTNPDDLGLSRWQVAAKFGGYLPGGGPGSATALAEQSGGESSKLEGHEDRTPITGPLPVDCMLCHRHGGNGYSPFVWTKQIEEQNFAYAPTAALGIATVTGGMKRLKGDFDYKATDAVNMLPKVKYEASKFRGDGKVFFDIVRKPENNSCYYCHTNTSAQSVTGSRWLHDEDVHIRAGIACVDCHRNGLDHHIVRGFDGEVHAAGIAATSLSCQGCHVPNERFEPLEVSGRLGAPIPGHRGLPPLHIEKLTCTACHSGSLPSEIIGRQLNSIVHHLGDHVRRTGQEFPGIVGPVPLVINNPRTDSTPSKKTTTNNDSLDGVDDLRYASHRMMWPSYWGFTGSGESYSPETRSSVRMDSQTAQGA